MKRFSVIVPLYNCEKYIRECLDSILAQTYGEFEIVVVNDGSTDGSLDIVRSYKDNRIKIVTQENRGLFHARLAGIKASKYDICLYVDADDMIKKGLLQKLSEIFEKGYDCVVYGFESFCEKGKVSNIKDAKIEPGEKLSKEPLRLFLQGKTIAPISCKAFYKDLVDVEKLDQYPRVAIGEDALHTLEIYEKMPRTFFINENFYLYRQNLNSMTHKLKISHYTDSVYRILKFRQSAEDNFKSNESEEILRDLPQRFFKLVLAFLLNPRYVVSEEGYRAFIEFVVNDDFFKENFEKYLKKCNFVYRYLIKKVRRKKYKFLLGLKKIISIVK